MRFEIWLYLSSHNFLKEDLRIISHKIHTQASKEGIQEVQTSYKV